VPRILLTQGIHPEVHERLVRAGDVRVAEDTTADTLRRSAQGCDVVVVRAPLPADIFEAAPTLIGAVRHGAGVDMIPVDAATARGVLVANAAGTNATSVAEHVVHCMIHLARQHAAVAAELAHGDAGGWARARATADAGLELSGRTLGLVGYGHVGQAIARTCARGLGMRVLAHTRSPLRAGTEWARRAELTELLHVCDFLVLACPLTEQTRALIGAAELQRMRRGSFLVNVARGPVVDEGALIDALRSGQLAGAALDVFDVQPLPADHAFRSLRQVLVTPHVAGISEDSMRRMGHAVARAVEDLLRGRMPDGCINPQAEPAFAARVGALRRDAPDEGD
jgi:D-3-phosphoglycerate dehydrogenase